MLCELIIENVAVIEKAHIYFQDGFTCLTGETGAGKSIIIDSINAIMGERVAKNIVRTGANKASVIAVFENIKQSVIEKAKNLGVDISQECIVQRQITVEGKTTARINGLPVAVAVLKEVLSDMVNIHGQHDSQSLLTPSKHIYILDSFGTDQTLLKEYFSCYTQYTAIQKQIKEIEQSNKNKSDSLELLAFQVKEISEAQLSQEEETGLQERKKVIKNAEHIISGLNIAYQCLSGSDDFVGSCTTLQQAAKETDDVAQFAQDITNISERLNEAAALAQDAMFDLRNFIDDFDVDLSEIEEIEERLDIYYRLKKKYGPEVSDVLQFLENAQNDLDNIEFAQEKLEALQQEQQVVRKQLVLMADRLTQNRKDVFKVLSKEIQKSLEFLNMPNVELFLSCEHKQYSATGQDEVEFTIVTNKGEAAKPLAKIASGGELSRIMLAIKSVLAEKEQTHTLIFDEIDAGVSGSAAVKIGKLLKQTAKGKQILCVTHSAQIAAFAHTHLLIEKSTKGQATYTSVRPLSSQEKEREVARIISGENITPTALLNAKEMIESAKNS